MWRGAYIMCASGVHQVGGGGLLSMEEWGGGAGATQVALPLPPLRAFAVYKGFSSSASLIETDLARVHMHALCPLLLLLTFAVITRASAEGTTDVWQYPKRRWALKEAKQFLSRYNITVPQRGANCFTPELLLQPHGVRDHCLRSLGATDLECECLTRDLETCAPTTLSTIPVDLVIDIRLRFAYATFPLFGMKHLPELPEGSGLLRRGWRFCKWLVFPGQLQYWHLLSPGRAAPVFGWSLTSPEQPGQRAESRLEWWLRWNLLGLSALCHLDRVLDLLLTFRDSASAPEALGKVLLGNAKNFGLLVLWYGYMHTVGAWLWRYSAELHLQYVGGLYFLYVWPLFASALVARHCRSKFSLIIWPYAPPSPRPPSPSPQPSPAPRAPPSRPRAVQWPPTLPLPPHAPLTDAEWNEMTDAADDHLKCPLTLMLLREPAVLNGRTYERTAIERHLRADPRDPETRQPVGPDSALHPNQAIRHAVESFIVVHRAERRRQVMELFDRADLNKSGLLEGHELHAALTELGLTAEAAAAQVAAHEGKEVGCDQFGRLLEELSLSTRLQGLGALPQVPSSEFSAWLRTHGTERLKRAFRRADTDNNRRLDAPEVRAALAASGMSSHDVTRIVRDYVKGPLDFADFGVLLATSGVTGSMLDAMCAPSLPPAPSRTPESSSARAFAHAARGQGLQLSSGSAPAPVNARTPGGVLSLLPSEGPALEAESGGLRRCNSSPAAPSGVTRRGGKRKAPDSECPPEAGAVQQASSSARNRSPKGARQPKLQKKA